MAIVRPNEPVDVRFLHGDQVYDTTSRRGEIIHEAFHHALPSTITVGHRLTFASADGSEVFADNFLGDIVDTYGSANLTIDVEPIRGSEGPWQTIGFDHLAISVADRAHARDFFGDVVGMKVMRDDPHLTVMATGPTALFLFDAGSTEPLSPGSASSWHHIGFVVDNLEHAYAHLKRHADRLSSDFTLLDRDERWSLYFFYRNGEVTFMIQFSEVKETWRGFVEPEKKAFADYLYDYASRPYGLRFGEDDKRAR
jgi:catechol 2,3-dioxygenase-like lactoylglutathione lyase family enzyme